MNRERILRFVRQMYQLYGLPHAELLRIVKADTCYPPQYRVAALRHLVCAAPLSVTGGRPYAERRRRVRKHYGI